MTTAAAAAAGAMEAAASTPDLPPCELLATTSSAAAAPSEADDASSRKAPVGTPLRALRERLSSLDTEGCPWLGYLPPALREALRHQNLHKQLLSSQSSSSASGLREKSVAGQVWSLSRDAVGCRAVQRALDEPSSSSCSGMDQRQTIAEELRGHVWEALQCPHANHVLQKCVVTLAPEDAQFIVDELMQGSRVLQAAQHKYGCRIVQKAIEFLPPARTEALVECLLGQVRSVSRHAYGNYVIQNLLEHGTAVQRDRIMKAIVADVRTFAADPYGCAVVASVFLHGASAERRQVAFALVEDENLLPAMACLRLGAGSISLVLEELPPQGRQEALRQLTSQADALRASRFGRQVLDHLSSETKATAALASPQPPLPVPPRRAAGVVARSSLVRLA